MPDQGILSILFIKKRNVAFLHKRRQQFAAKIYSGYFFLSETSLKYTPYRLSVEV
jgi:hypothetical protein